MVSFCDLGFEYYLYFEYCNLEFNGESGHSTFFLFPVAYVLFPKESGRWDLFRPAPLERGRESRF